MNSNPKTNSDEHKDMFATECLITGYICGTKIKNKIYWKYKQRGNVFYHHIQSSRLKNANPQADTWFAETDKSFECTLK